MRTRWWLWVVFLVLGACSKPSEHVLSVRFGMSFDDIAKQNPELAEAMKDGLEHGGVQYTSTFKRLELLDLPMGESFFVFHDVEVELRVMYDWIVHAKIQRRRGATLDEVRGIVRAIHARGVPCRQIAGSTWAMETIEHEDPCLTLASSVDLPSSRLTCPTSLDGTHQEFDFSVRCVDPEPPSSGARTLGYDLHFGFSFLDGMRLIKPAYEAKYGPLGVDLPRYFSPAETFELWQRPGFDRERYRNEGDAYLREFSRDKP